MDAAHELKTVTDLTADSDTEQAPCQLPDHTTRIPEETLLVIFRHALPPSWAARTASTLPPFPRTVWSNSSADLDTKLSLISVCKTWHRIGLQFLYESVGLHSIGQLPAFVRALEARAAVGAFVRRLEIGYWVSRGYHALHDKEIKTIFALCPRLAHFAFNPQPLPGEPLPAFPELARPVHEVPSQCITHLEISDRTRYPAVLPALTLLAPTLQSLSILLPISSAYPAPSTHPPLAFPLLSHLRLGLADDSVLPAPGARWAIPNLQQLLIRDSGMHLSAAGYNALVRALLDAYGRSVRVLKVLPVRGGYRVQELLERCPALEHLCVSVFVADSDSETAGWGTHGRLHYLEFLRDPASGDEGADAQEFERLKGVFPALRACRYVDPCHELFPQLPLPLPPPLPLTDSASASASASDSDALPTSSWLAFIASSASDDSDEDDEDYVFDLAEDDGGSVDGSDSDSDSEDGGSGRDSEGEDWAEVEVDREEALAIFRRTLTMG